MTLQIISKQKRENEKSFSFRLKKSRIDLHQINLSELYLSENKLTKLIDRQKKFY